MIYVVRSKADCTKYLTAEAFRECGLDEWTADRRERAEYPTRDDAYRDSRAFHGRVVRILNCDRTYPAQRPLSHETRRVVVQLARRFFQAKLPAKPIEISMADAAKRRGVTRSAIIQAVAAGKIRVVRQVGRNKLLDLSSVDATRFTARFRRAWFEQ